MAPNRWREYGFPRDPSFHLRDRWAAVFAALTVPMLVVALRHGSGWWGILALALVVVAALHIPLFRFLAVARGRLFAISCFPLLLVYDWTCITGFLAGLFREERRRDAWLAASLLICAGLILGLQIVGGAYHAEFNGDPDEAAHLISGLMIYDYQVAWPAQTPFAWAMRYYLHYPRVAIGHWPPGFFVMEALWWLIFPPSRWSSMLLNAALALVAAGFVYRLIRAFAPGWLALGAALLLIATPVMQQSLGLSMSDVACLLWSVLLMDATTRLVRQPSPVHLTLVGLWLICALLTKGTGACLAPAPLLALLIAGKWRAVPLRWAFGTAGAVLFLGFGWYAIEALVLGHDVRSWGGMTVRDPWPIVLVPELAGYGVVVLACAGVCAAILRRKPGPIAATAVLLSTAAVSFFLRAMNAPRLWIIVLPAMLVLSAEFLAWLQTLSPLGILAGVPALILFPFAIYHQQPLGLAQLLSQVRRPARMLVASSVAGEGAWIAEVALAEKRPASVVVRATKALASMGPNGGHYRLITKTPGEVEKRLDELGIEAVISTPEPGTPGATDFPHYALLEQALRNSDSWRLCGASGTSTLYCRVKPARVPRVPLRIDLRTEIGRILEE